MLTLLCYEQREADSREGTCFSGVPWCWELSESGWLVWQVISGRAEGTRGVRAGRRSHQTWCSVVPATRSAAESHWISKHAKWPLRLRPQQVESRGTYSSKGFCPLLGEGSPGGGSSPTHPLPSCTSTQAWSRSGKAHGTASGVFWQRAGAPSWHGPPPAVVRVLGDVLWTHWHVLSC